MPAITPLANLEEYAENPNLPGCGLHFEIWALLEEDIEGKAFLSGDPNRIPGIFVPVKRGR